ncbi:ribonuclease HIII [Ktedonobacteria bacterium brp13]|nr:ribonuclease HIII [Ktedonobacteria bacterium brp13]
MFYSTGKKDKGDAIVATDRLVASINNLRQFVNSHGWSITDEKEIAHGYRLLISDGTTNVPVALYATGSVLVQGKVSPLQIALKQWGNKDKTETSATIQHSLLETASTTATVKPALSQMVGLARIGSDESGKGDFYGPLAIAAVYVDATTEHYLNSLGVRDSKKLTDRMMLPLAASIMQHCPYSLLVYAPEQYNDRYQAIRNLNLLLAEAHAQVITELANKTQSQLAIVDQFGAESLVRQALAKTGCHVRLEQRHRAEEDTAVAAASIVARAAFVKAINELSALYGIELPKGASNPRIVEVGRELVTLHGQAALRKVGKLHFKTTEAILPTTLTLQSFE